MSSEDCVHGVIRSHCENYNCRYVTCYTCGDSVAKADCRLNFSNAAKTQWDCMDCVNRIWITSIYCHHYVMRNDQTIASFSMADYTLKQVVAEVQARYPTANILTKTGTDEHEVVA